MKPSLFISNSVLFVLCIILCGQTAFSQDNDDIYYRTAGHPPHTNEVTFVRITSPEKYMTGLDLDDLRDSIGARSITSWDSRSYCYNVDFIGEDNNPNRAQLMMYIFNSRENAETFALDLFGITSGWYIHAVDREEDIDLGDNAWLSGSLEETGGYDAIDFTRNNVYVSISVEYLPHPETALNLCKKIDRYIVEHSTSNSPDSVLVPEILSTEVLSIGTIKDRPLYTLSVNAVDPVGGTLYYRMFYDAFYFCTDGIVKTSLFEHETSRILWVMNERLLVASKEIFN